MPNETTQIELIAVAKELNKLLILEPKIKTVGSNEKLLKKEISLAATLLDAKDTLTKQTIDTLKVIEVALPGGVLVLEEPPPIQGKDDLSLEDLITTVIDMNFVMGLKPAINLEGMDIEDLILAITNECFDDKQKCQIYTTDEFGETTIETLKTLNISPVDLPGEPEAAPTPPDEAQAPTLKKADKKEKLSKTTNKKPQVISSIVKIIKEKGPISKTDILGSLAEIFPTRKKESMMKTINLQVPHRLTKDKGLEFIITPEKFEIV